jgi:hypothetical protein
MIRCFLKNESGSVGLWVVFAMSALMLLFAIVVDISRYLAVKSRATAAAQSVAVLAVSNYGFVGTLDFQQFIEDQVSTKLNNGVLPMLQGSSLSVSPVTISYLEQGRYADISFNVSVPTTVLNVVELEQIMVVSVQQRAERLMSKTEVVMVLDNSVQVGASGKNADIRQAASHFVDALSGLATAAKFSVAIIPNATQKINVGPFEDWVDVADWPTQFPPIVPGIKLWTGPLSAQRWCVLPRSLSSMNDLTLPNDQLFPLSVAVSKQQGAGGGDEFFIDTDVNCPTNQIRPFGQLIGSVDPYLNSLTTAGDFYPGRAMVWARRLLAPSWRSVWEPSTIPSGNVNSTRKIVVLIGGSSPIADAADRLSFDQTCQELKAEGARIFIMDYGGGNSSLENCSNRPANYRIVSSYADLNVGLLEIARSLMNAVIVPL